MKLPLKCDVDYFKEFLDQSEAKELFDELLQIAQNQIFQPKTHTGEIIPVNFVKTMFLEQELFDQNIFPEQVWGPTQPKSKNLQKLTQKIESKLNETFPVCVMIYYPDGNSGVDFHSDLPAFGDTSVIPSISLGAERKFLLKENATKEIFTTKLENGSLIVMGKGCQNNYEHSLPESPTCHNPRINLTFRKYGY